MPRTRRAGWVIDRAKLTALVDKTGRSRAAISAEIGFEDANVAARLSRKTAFGLEEVERYAAVLGCEVSDFASLSEEASSRSDAGPVAGAEGRETALQVLDSDAMREKYEAFDSSSFVLVFSMDGYLEAGNRYFREIVFGAVKRGLEIIYLFPDSEVARLSREHYELLVELALKDRLRLQGHFVDASNAYIATRAARFVLVGKKTDDDTRIVDTIFLYLHSKQDYWIELDLREHKDFIAELQAAIDPIPYMPVPVWKKNWHLPPFVQERYQTSFTRDSKTYSRLRQIVSTDESALRIAKHAVDHFDKIRFDHENDVVHWLDIGCEDGANTAVIHDYLQQHHFNIALTAIDTSLQAMGSSVLQYATFLHGKKWTFEHFSTALPRHQKFDLITSLHSWYVIDPIYLVEAYRRLSPRGSLIVTMGPYKADDYHGGNFINIATGAIDALIAREAGLEPKDDVYRHKAVRDDPYRNYAEDILTACRHFFGQQNEDFFVEIDDRRISADLVLRKADLTEAGRAISHFFAHGLPPQGGQAAMFSRVFDLLCDLRTDDNMLPAAEFDILIDRQTIMRRQAKRLRLRARH